VFSHKSSTAEAFAILFSVLSRKEYDRRYVKLELAILGEENKFKPKQDLVASFL